MSKLEIEDSSNNSPGLRSLVSAALADNVDEEKCVVAQYRTTVKQRNEFQALVNSCEKNYIPIEWVIDIADESNGWFYGTAYHFDDTNHMLHVMVPDKVNPSFDGNVLLDHRTVHLIECVDGKSEALFNKIVRDSVIKVKWDVEWFEEVEEGKVTQDWGAVEGVQGNWILSSARYYIRIANQLLVEDKDSGQDARGFVILTADLNLKLITCHKNKGIDDFNRLINEGTVQASPEATEAAKNYVSSPSGGSPVSDWNKKTKSKFNDNLSPENNATSIPPVRKLSDMSRGLRECLGDVLDDREKIKKTTLDLANMFNTFTLEGDLDVGMKLFDMFEKIKEKESGDNKDDKMEAAADEAWYLSQKIEKSLVKVVRAGVEFSTNSKNLASNTADDYEEIDNLKKSMKKMKKDLEEKDKELQKLRVRN